MIKYVRTKLLLLCLLFSFNSSSAIGMTYVIVGGCVVTYKALSIFYKHIIMDNLISWVMKKNYLKLMTTVLFLSNQCDIASLNKWLIHACEENNCEAIVHLKALGADINYHKNNNSNMERVFISISYIDPVYWVTKD